MKACSHPQQKPQEAQQEKKNSRIGSKQIEGGKTHSAGPKEQIFPLRSTQNRPAQEKEKKRQEEEVKPATRGPLTGGGAAITLRPTEPSALPLEAGRTTG